MPQVYKDISVPNTVVIIDCAEAFIETYLLDFKLEQKPTLITNGTIRLNF